MSETSKSKIETLRQDCTGCYACVNKCPKHCISMENDEEGFEYPSVDQEKCIGCHMCVSICPILNQREQYPQAYACINKEEAVRMESSSGGVFTLLAEYVLSQGGIVYGAAFNDSCEVVHTGVTDRKDLGRLRGSKYVQSRIGNAYSEVESHLKSGRLVYFSGTPCQVAGLKHFLGQTYGNLLCQDLICHGVPSPKVWEQYLKLRVGKMEPGLGTHVRINFRQKDSGWNLFELSIKDMDSSYKCYHGKDMYMQAFLKNMDLRKSCYRCHFKGLNRQADITLADFWGIDGVMKDMDDNKGTSLVLVNSEKGNTIFQRIKDQMKYARVNAYQAVLSNSAAYQSVQEPEIRKRFFEEMSQNNFEQYLRKVTEEKMRVRIKRHVYGMLRRIRRMVSDV